MANEKRRPGPQPGSKGAARIAEAHRGSHEHDRDGGFAADPILARTAGRLGGERVKEKYGSTFYTEIGRKGGEAVRDAHGAAFYSRIGKKGREARVKRQQDNSDE